MSKITKSARMEDCAVRAPGICNFNPETTVFAHAPSADKGMGKKSPDYWGAYACSDCHAFLDNRHTYILLREDSYQYWMPAIFETQKKLIEKGLLNAAGG